jgi:LysR family hydrogen peroxide-inducible transcriptional activator
MLSLQQMHYVLVLSEELQFQKASEKCFVTQPTLSMQIKKAEDTLGHFIFDRSKHPMELTAFGKLIVPVIRDILTENDKLKLISERLKGNIKEEIRLGIIPTVSAYLVQKMFGFWHRTLDNITLNIEELKTNELIEKLENNEIDIAILAGPHFDPKLRTIPLFKEEIFVYCPSVNNETITFEQLHQMHPWLLNKGNCLRTQMIHFCQIGENQNAETWNYQGGNIDLLIEMVNENDGYTLVPENIRLEENKKIHLKRICGPEGFPAREIIGLFNNRSIKKESIEKMLRTVQLQYSQSGTEEKLSVLSWK